MISYDPLWQLLEERKISLYSLIRNHNFSNTTLARMKKGKHISTATIEQLCKILNCGIEDILVYQEDKKED